MSLWQARRGAALIKLTGDSPQGSMDVVNEMDCCFFFFFFFYFFFFFKQKTAYEIVSRDGSSDVCSSDLFIRINFVLTHRINR